MWWHERLHAAQECAATCRVARTTTQCAQQHAAGDIAVCHSRHNKVSLMAQQLQHFDSSLWHQGLMGWHLGSMSGLRPMQGRIEANEGQRAAQPQLGRNSCVEFQHGDIFPLKRNLQKRDSKYNWKFPNFHELIKINYASLSMDNVSSRHFQNGLKCFLRWEVSDSRETRWLGHGHIWGHRC